jgi:hypothetical protein
MLDEAARELHKLAQAAIFDRADWPLSGERVEQLWRSLAKWGVTEESCDGIRYTDPAARPEIELLLSCIGAIEPWDIPFFLKEYGYVSEEEALEVWDADTDSEAHRLLKIILIRSYFRRFIRSKMRH